MQKLLTKASIVATAVMALTAAGAANAAPAASHAGQAQAVKGSSAALSVLYDQTANDSGIAIVSQNFETGNDPFDSQAADDFVVPAGASWAVGEVDVLGQYFNGFGLATSEHVTFYKDKNGKPGKVIADFPGLVGTDNGTGSFAITLPTPVKLKAGTYWVAVQIDMDFTVGGEWGWENQTTVEGAPAKWANPGDGFLTGCTKYQTETICIPDGQGDHAFRLKGKAK